MYHSRQDTWTTKHWPSFDKPRSVRNSHSKQGDKLSPRHHVHHHIYVQNTLCCQSHRRITWQHVKHKNTFQALSPGKVHWVKTVRPHRHTQMWNGHHLDIGQCHMEAKARSDIYYIVMIHNPSLPDTTCWAVFPEQEFVSQQSDTKKHYQRTCLIWCIYV